MSEVVHMDPARAAYEAEVRELCGFARIPDRAAVYIARHASVKDVLDDCIVVAFGQRHPADVARHMQRLIGPAGYRRRTLQEGPTRRRRP